MLPARRPRRSPSLAVQQLEDRSVPANSGLYISEVHFAFSLSGSQDKDQYFELRGAPNAVIPQGTYFTVVDSDAPGPGTSTGTIHSVFDLSGLQLGSDGYLVVVEGGSNWKITPTATVVKGSGAAGSGFVGLSGPNDPAGTDRFSDDSGLSNRFEFILGADTFMLVQAASAPIPLSDADANNDGTLDGAAAKWTVIDSVGELGTFVGADANQISYGKVTFGVKDASGNPQGHVPAGTQFIPASSFGYVARLGESTGYTSADWFAGLTRETAANSYDFVLDPLFFGQPTIGYLAGRHLDNLGTANMVSSLDGTKFLDANSNGVLDPGEGPQAGATFFLDRNGDGIQDSYGTAVEPDSYPTGAANSLTNTIPGLTLSVANNKNVQTAVDVNPQKGAGTTGTQVFGHFGFNWFDDGARLRMDFYHPVQSISIDYTSTTGSGNAGDVFNSYGRLSVYAADGTLLDTYLTAALGKGSSETMTLTRPTADIAYAVAYTDSTVGFEFGLLDNLSYSQPEDTTVSQADGLIRLGGLQDGTYTMYEVPLQGFFRTTPAGGSYTATITNTVPARGLDFGNIGGPLIGNFLPVSAGGGTLSVSPATAVGQFDTGQALTLAPFPGFTGTIRSAFGDVNGDGVADYILITGPQAGYPTRLAVISGKTQAVLLGPTAPFAGSEDFDGGGFVAAGDFNGDAKAEIVASPDQGGGARIVLLDVVGGRTRVFSNFLGIADPNFRGGAQVAVGDVNRDGTPDVAVAAGFQGGPRVAVFDGRTVRSNGPSRLIGDFYAFPGDDVLTLRNGVNLAAGDVNGDGYADLIFGGGAGGAARVEVLSGRQLMTFGVDTAQATPLLNFFVNGDADGRGGIRVAVVNADGDNKLDLAVASGAGVDPLVRVYLGSTFGGGEPPVAQDVPVTLPDTGLTLDDGQPLLPDGIYIG